MRTAISKHTLPLTLPERLALLGIGRLALLGMLVSLALSPAAALAAAGGATTTTNTTGATTASAAGGASPTPPAASKPTLATWFGPGFYGHATACGQTMSPALVGVASRTLPCGTLVQIGYRGHQLTVPVLDRGPYGRSGAVWDLTAGAARALKIKDTVRIATQIVGSVPNAPTLGLPPGASGLEAPAGGAASTAAPGGAGGAESTAATGGATAG